MSEPRIVTLTLNPAVDLACEAAAVEPTHKIRTTAERLDPGGGGINVSRVLHAMGGRTLAVFLAGGPTGRVIDDLLREAGVPARAVPIRGRTRISQTVTDRGTGLEYRFVAEGPEVREAEWRGLLTLLDAVDCDWVVGSGSLPRGVPVDFYAQAARIARRRGQRFALDTSGEPLRAALAEGVEVVKPSLSELEALLGRAIPDAAQEAAAQSLVRTGQAQVVAVSLGEHGAVLATAQETRRLPALQVEVRGAVGAGDSFMAGLVLSLAHGDGAREAFAWAVATGAAAVAAEGTARPTREAVMVLRRRIRMRPG